MRNLALFLLSFISLHASSILPKPSAIQQKIDDKLLAFFVPTENAPWYIGAGVSFMDSFSYTNTQTSNLTTPTLFNNNSSITTVSAPSIGYNLCLGHAFNPFLYAEFKGTQLITPFHLSNYVQNTAPAYSGPTKLYLATFGPYVLINLPMYPLFTPIIRVGIVTNALKIDQTLEQGSTSGSETTSVWAEKLHLGGGFKSTFSDTFLLKLEFETPIFGVIFIPNTLLQNNALYLPGILSFTASVFF